MSDASTKPSSSNKPPPSNSTNTNMSTSHMSTIQPLSQASITRLVAEQAIVDLPSIVKELVDNALDAQATHLNIRLFGQGLDIVEVSDNGVGVPKASRPLLCTRYATSKLQNFEQLYSSTTSSSMGFRGEALFSLAALSQNVLICTKCEGEELAETMEFDRTGGLLPEKTQVQPRKVGTTVAVVKPFHSLPARRADLKRRIQRERQQLYKLMESYAIFHPHVQLHLMDVVNQQEQVALATKSCHSIKDTIASVLGYKTLQTLSPIEWNWNLSDSIECKMTGYLSTSPKNPTSTSNSKTVRTVQYFTVNGRPVELPSIVTVLKNVWHGLGGSKKPCILLQLSLPNNQFDINVAPDKRTVLLTNEAQLLTQIQTCATEFWKRHTDGHFQVHSSTATASTASTSILETPEKHKRRNAFVHDLSKAKMQHEHERRQSVTEEDFQQQASTNENWNTQQRIQQQVQQQQRRSLEQASRSEDSAVATSAATMEDPSASSTDNESSLSSPANKRRRISSSTTSTTTATSTTDRERQQWTAVQSKFLQSGTNESSDPQVTSQNQKESSLSLENVTGSKKQNHMPRVEPTAAGTTPAAGRVSSGSTTSFLAQFAHQPTSTASTSTTTKSYQHQQTTLSLPAAVVTTKHKNHRALAPVEASSKRKHKEEGMESTSTSGTVIPQQVQTAKRQRAEPASESSKQPQPPSFNEHETNHPAEDDVSTSRSTAVHLVTPKGAVDFPTSSPKSIVWKSFQGGATTASLAYRRERAAMLQRKIDLKGKSKKSESSLPSYSDKDDEEDGALQATTTVGVQHESSTTSTIRLSKQDFTDFQVIGQFNLGFILCQSKRDGNLWILDQHACDEKYNFEALCQNTQLHHQPLIQPIPLELSAAEESCILDHLSVFQANGFGFQFTPEAPIQKRLQLTALPHSGAQEGRNAVQYTADDVAALCALLLEGSSYDAGDGGTGTDGSGQYGNNAVRRYASNVSATQTQNEMDTNDTKQQPLLLTRLPKSIAMFASRACRTSIMIGTSLSLDQMTRIVKRLANVEHPWNCPHGRPTMRHVGNLEGLLIQDERAALQTIADATMTVVPLTQQPNDEEAEAEEEED